MFKEPVARTAKLLASKSSSPVYFYEFGYRGEYSLSNKYVKNGNSDGLGIPQLYFLLSKLRIDIIIRLYIIIILSTQEYHTVTIPCML